MDDRDSIQLNSYVNLIFAQNAVHPLSRESFIIPGKINILMTHHLITKKKMIYDHFLIDEFDTNADIVLLADYHPRQGIIVKDDTTFVSPGAIARKKNTTSDRQRKPALALIKTDGSKKPIIKFKGLKCESDVFVDVIEDESDEEEIDFNVKELNELINEDLIGGDIKTMVKTYGNETNVSEHIIEFVLNEMENI
jgi:DNA repair exonuclease SbcCD nuclease subunit